MMPLSNAEIQARKTPDQLAAERGQVTQVSQMRALLRSHSLVWSRNDAEIRDGARQDAVIFSGTLAEATAEAKRRGLWPSS